MNACASFAPLNSIESLYNYWIIIAEIANRGNKILLQFRELYELHLSSPLFLFQSLDNVQAWFIGMIFLLVRLSFFRTKRILQSIFTNSDRKQSTMKYYKTYNKTYKFTFHHKPSNHVKSCTCASNNSRIVEIKSIISLTIANDPNIRQVHRSTITSRYLFVLNFLSIFYFSFKYTSIEI